MLITPNWLHVCLNHISVFTLCVLLPLAAAVIWFSCRESWMFHLPPFISLSLSVSLTKLSKFSQTLPPFLAGSAASACIGCYCTQSTKYSLQQRLAYSGHSTTIQQVQQRHELRLTRGSPQQEPNSYNCSSGRSKHAAQIRLSANVKLLNASHTHTCLMLTMEDLWPQQPMRGLCEQLTVTPGFGQLSPPRS